MKTHLTKGFSKTYCGIKGVFYDRAWRFDSDNECIVLFVRSFEQASLKCTGCESAYNMELLARVKL